MGVVTDPQKLRRELARRGWTAADLARDSGVSAPTVTAALAGRPVAAHTVQAIADSLARTPGLPEMDRLLPDTGPVALGPGDGIGL